MLVSDPLVILDRTMGGADDLRHILDGTTIAVLKQIEGLEYS
jgi:hypothetical protein